MQNCQTENEDQATPAHGGNEMYYEITHNGDKSETYVDVYKKWDNKCVPD